ncbi:MAG: hypothetical protein LUC94_06420 [Clostridiales bacterium]|nr:hypothetical protein [Clostridiales bacterium]
MVYDLAAEEPENYTFSDTIPVAIYPGFSIDFSTICL